MCEPTLGTVSKVYAIHMGTHGRCLYKVDASIEKFAKNILKLSFSGPAQKDVGLAVSKV